MITALLVLFSVASVGSAAEPPELLNYQGVLRDDTDDAIDGTRDMIFHLYDAPGDAFCEGGTLLLTDAHQASGTGAVTVTGGLFNVAIGSGSVTPGTESSLGEVFSDNDPVYLQVTVAAEKLCPRIRVLSAGYSLNADHLDGQDATYFLDTSATTQEKTGLLVASGGVDYGPGASDDLLASDVTTLTSGGTADTLHTHGSVGDADTVDGKHANEFIDTSSTSQTKSGQLFIDSSGVAASYGIQASGQSHGGYFEDSDNSGYAYVGYADRGIEASGTVAGGYFHDQDDGGYAWVGSGLRGIEAYGNEMGGYFRDANSSGFAYVGHGERGIEAHGNLAGGYFKDDDSSGYAYVGYGHLGIDADGSEAGGYFRDLDGSGYAYVGYGDRGVEARGNEMGGYFADREGTSDAQLAYGSSGIEANGNEIGGAFFDRDQSGYAYSGYGDRGIEAGGNEMGGAFFDLDQSGYAFVGYGGRGIDARGNEVGGYFEDRDGAGFAYVGYNNRGIEAWGNEHGAYFKDLDQSGRAYLGSGDRGIEAHGNIAGGYFKDENDSGYAFVGYGGCGIDARGNQMGGYFEDLTSLAYARIAYDDTGIEGRGRGYGGHFEDIDSSGFANAAKGDRGIEGYGNEAGGYFLDTDSDSSAAVAYGTYKIKGNGSVSFVQNHPENPDRVIVYTAPEGDETATYTRGTARLIGGEATVALGDTFQWVTNPDIGLTAYLTPHADCNGLYVESLTTSELVVRELAGGTSDTVFDYIVYGLRIGFEEVSVVQEKKGEAYIPSMQDHRDLYAREPDFQPYNALERFKGMHIASGLVINEGPFDFSRAWALRDAVEEYDPAVHGPVGGKPLQHESLTDDIEGRQAGQEAMQSGDARSRTSPGVDGASPTTTLPMDADGNVYGRSFRPSATDLASLVAVSEAVELGDVVVADPLTPGLMRRASLAGDPSVVGIVAGQAGLLLGSAQMEAEGEEPETTGEADAPGDTLEPPPTTPQIHAPVAFSGIVLCKVDAGYGAVQVGDLLATSPTPGHAMRTLDPLPGTTLGKALESLDSGTGLIRVLVMLR
jgi:hypothetical protein